MQILLTILRKVTHSYKNHQTCQRALRFIYAPFDLSTVNTLLIYRFYTGEKIICFVIGVTYEMPINAVSFLQSL